LNVDLILIDKPLSDVLNSSNMEKNFLNTIKQCFTALLTARRFMFRFRGKLVSIISFKFV